MSRVRGRDEAAGSFRGDAEMAGKLLEARGSGEDGFDQGFGNRGGSVAIFAELVDDLEVLAEFLRGDRLFGRSSGDLGDHGFHLIGSGDDALEGFAGAG